MCTPAGPLSGHGEAAWPAGLVAAIAFPRPVGGLEGATSQRGCAAPPAPCKAASQAPGQWFSPPSCFPFQQEVLRSLEARGIAVRVASRHLAAEEAPESYKDVEAVVETCQAAGLSRKVARLRPVAVVKG